MTILRQIRQKHIPACHSKTYQVLRVEEEHYIGAIDKDTHTREFKVRKVKCVNNHCNLRENCGFTSNHYFTVPNRKLDDKRSDQYKARKKGGLR